MSFFFLWCHNYFCISLLFSCFYISESTYDLPLWMTVVLESTEVYVHIANGMNVLKIADLSVYY